MFRIIPAHIILLLISATLTGQDFAKSYFPGEDLVKKTEKLLFIKVTTDKKEAYEGEPVLATYLLYVGLDLQGKLSRAPSFSGFASFEIEPANTDSYEIEYINGNRFRVYLIKKLLLFGNQPGYQTLEPIELDATVSYQKKAANNESVALGDTLLPYTVRSNSISIRVKELPPFTGSGFSGAVGQFSRRLFAARGQLYAGEADTVHLLVQGTGNWHEVSIPRPIWPSGLEIFEPYEKEDIKPGMQGSRTLSFPVSCSATGTFFIYTEPFIYFDPASQRYEVLKRDTIELTVLPPKEKPGIGPQATSNYPRLFSRVVMVLFPITALLLLILLRKSKSNIT